MIAEIHARGRMPLLVGGTLLYFARCNRLVHLPTANKKYVRDRSTSQTHVGGTAAELARVDPPRRAYSPE